MSPSDDEIERYARQIIVPGIGVQGQERLLGAHVLVVGAARGVAQASLYLRAAGVNVVNDPADLAACSPAPSAVVVAGADCLSPAIHRLLISCGLPLCWYVLEQGGFTSGCHPQAPMPHAAASSHADAIHEALHDAAACDAAAVACAFIVGLASFPGPFQCNLD